MTRPPTASPLPEWLLAHRAELVFPSDSPAFRAMGVALRELLLPAAAALDDDVGLDQLHEYIDDALSVSDDGDDATSPIILHAAKLAGHKLRGAQKKRLSGRARLHFQNSDERYQRFLAAFDEFVEQIIAPLCGDASGIVHQRPPTLRVQLPHLGARAGKGRGTTALHCDADYPRHEAAEINFWVPFTKVYASNTLHVESAPGRGDYRAVELTPGEALRFNGSTCRHYTIANATQATRVSLDFRAIPQSLYGGKGGLIGDYPSRVVTGPIALDPRASSTDDLDLDALDGRGAGAMRRL